MHMHTMDWFTISHLDTCPNSCESTNRKTAILFILRFATLFTLACIFLGHTQLHICRSFVATGIELDTPTELHPLRHWGCQIFKHGTHTPGKYPSVLYPGIQHTACRLRSWPPRISSPGTAGCSAPAVLPPATCRNGSSALIWTPSRLRWLLRLRNCNLK